MKKVLIFDCWLPGFTYVGELAKRTESVAVEFVHTSSLQTGAPAREYEEFKKKYNAPAWVHDFIDYDYDFKRMFEVLKPDAVLVLSLHHLEARTALRYAKHLGVPTYFIPHGIFLLRDAPEATNTMQSLGARIQLLFSKLPRVAYYTNFFWRFHFSFQRNGLSGPGFRNALAVYRSLIGEYFHWQWYPNAATQDYYAAIIDNLIVYDASLEAYYNKNYGRMVDGSRFVASGTLDVAKLTSRLESLADTVQSSKRTAYFVSSPYPEYFGEPQASICKDLVRKLRDLVVTAGYDRLVYRPHPGETDEFTSFICDDLEIEVDTVGGIGGIVTSELICGTSSSLLYLAVILQKRILILDSQRLLVDAPYYEPLISYPKVNFNADLDRDDKALSDLLVQGGQMTKPDISELKDPVSDFIDLIYDRYVLS